MFELTPEEQITKAKITLQDSHPFFAYILMNMKCKKSEDLPTMGVNQFGDLFWNEEFTMGLTRDEVHGVLAHEAMHVATLTFQRKKNRDHTIWNVATDFAINWLLKKEGFTLPTGVLMADDNGIIEIPCSKGKNKGKTIKYNIENRVAEEIYDKLIQNAEVIKVAWGDGDDGIEGQFDKHIEGDKDDKGESQGKGKTDADIRENEQNWKSKATEAATHAKARGHLSSNLGREMEDILDPKIDWRKKLQEFITKDLPIDYTMRLPGRRSQALGFYMPSVVRENLEVMVAVDVSGSIGQKEYNDFMSEVVGIAGGFDQLKMRCIFWSTYVDPEDDIEVYGEGIDKLLNHKVKNSGGTTLSCVAKYMEEKNYNSPVVIFLTDGYIEKDPIVPGTNMLFVLSENSDDSIVSKLGEVTKLSDMER